MRLSATILLLFPVLVSSQENPTIHLLEERAGHNPDSVKAVTLQTLGHIPSFERAPFHHVLGVCYKVTGLYDSAVFHLMAEDSLLHDKGDLESAVKNQVELADVYYVRGDLVNSEKHYKTALRLVEGSANYQLRSTVLLGCGWLSREQGRHAQALDYYFQATRLAQLNGDEDLLANCYGKIAIVYNVRGDLVKAREYYYKSLDMRLVSGNMPAVASLYNNIGLLHDYAKDYDSAIFFFEKAIHVSDSLGDPRGVAIANENIGLMLYQKRENLPYALERLKNSLDYWRSKNDVFGQSQTLVYITYVYNALENYPAALDSGKRALGFAIEAGARDVERDALEHLSIACEGLNRQQEALDYYKRHIRLRDSLEAINTSSQIEHLAMEHEFAKDSLNLALMHEKEQAAIRVDVEAGKFWNKLLLIGLFVLVVLAILAFLFSRQQKKNAGLIARANLMLRVKNKEIIDSITYARRIQEAILPASEAIQSVFRDSFVFYRPKDIVAGDFYWLSERTAGNRKLVFFAVADCTGHGVPGAMVSVICSSALNKAINEQQLNDPGQILNRVTDLVVETFEKSGTDLKDGMDIALCAFDFSTGQLHYAGANNPVWIVSRRAHISESGNVLAREDNTLFLHEVKATKQPVGKFAQHLPFQTHSVQLLKDDLVYLFTDGFADQFGGLKNKKFKYITLKKLVLSIAGETTDRQCGTLQQSFETWKGSFEQIDDVCVVGIRV